jgi:hypothetical protein
MSAMHVRPRFLLPFVLCLGFAAAPARPQSRPDGASREELLKSAARLATLSEDVARVASQTRRDPNERSGELERLVEEIAEMSISLARQSTIHAIRAEESFRLDLQESDAEAAAAEDDLRTCAESLARSIGSSLARSVAGANPNDAAADLERALASARDTWSAAAAAATTKLGAMKALREGAAAKHTDGKKLAARIAQDAASRLDLAVDAVAKVDAALGARVAQTRTRIESQRSILAERGRLAQERTLLQLDLVVARRADALSRAQRKLGAGLNELVAAQAAGEHASGKRIGAWVRESASVLQELAAHNRGALDARAAAVRSLWEQADPVGRARGLEVAERARMLEERRHDEADLRLSRAQLEDLRGKIDALKRQAAAD